MYHDTTNIDGEVMLSSHSKERWIRRRMELQSWINRNMQSKQMKRTVLFGGTPVDEQLYAALTKLRICGIHTEFSCAGVSPLDEPVDHSLYAYITFSACGPAERLAVIIRDLMRHRALLSYEPARKQYDVSSFFIGHNRSFCLLMERCADQLEREHKSDCNTRQA